MINEDKIMKILQEIETKESTQEHSKLSYGKIYNELINPFMLMNYSLMGCDICEYYVALFCSIVQVSRIGIACSPHIGTPILAFLPNVA